MEKNLTGNGILVAMGNKLIQYGCQIENREDNTPRAHHRQEIELYHGNQSERGYINCNETNKQIKKQIQWNK